MTSLVLTKCAIYYGYSILPLSSFFNIHVITAYRKTDKKIDCVGIRLDLSVTYEGHSLVIAFLQSDSVPYFYKKSPLAPTVNIKYKKSTSLNLPEA